MRSRNALVRALLVAALGVAALMLPSVASAKDRNHDRIPDRWEKSHGLSLRVNQAHRDQDRDKLVNRKEFKAGDDPLNPDSDGDGIEDGDEGAGTISSFDGTTLTINLFNGSSITGTVDESTEVGCGGSDDDQGDDDSGDDDGPGDDAQAKHAHGGHGNRSGANGCSVDDLIAGATVQEAELELVHGDAVFCSVEIIK